MKGLGKTYTGGRQVLRDIWLSFLPGVKIGVIGLNGSGKSTLLKTVMGIVRAQAGTVHVLGLAPDDARRAGLVGYVPQSEDVDWTFPITVREVVTMGRYGRMGPLRRSRAADVAAVDVALERVGLTALGDRQVGELSGGQRKRVFVARCLAQEAPVLLLDEPFAGVDHRSATGITALLRALAAEGRAVLVSTHDLQGLATLADDVVMLATRVIATGSPAEVLQPRHLARLMGLDGADIGSPEPEPVPEPERGPEPEPREEPATDADPGSTAPARATHGGTAGGVVTP
jgi:manganese transport system ATP-binding protein